MEPDLEKYIIESTTEIFETMVFVELQPGKRHIGSDIDMDADIASCIGFGGDIRGLIGVHCPLDVATGITGAMLGMEFDEITDDVKDAIGEIANMIAGGVKTGLAGSNKDIQLAVPSTACGKSLRIGGPARGSSLVVPFTVDAGTFYVEMRYMLS